MGIYEGSPDVGGVGGSSVLKTINKFGEQLDIDTADAVLGQIIWTVKSSIQQYLFIDSAIQLFAVSTSTEDAPGLTGARSIILTNWHGADGNEADPYLLTMNGTVNVPLPQLSFGVFSAEVEESGSNEKNVGAINIVDGAGNIYAQIFPNEGRTQACVQRIPNNRMGTIIFLKSGYSRAGGNNDAVLRGRIRKPNGTFVTVNNFSLSTIKPEYNRLYTSGGIKLTAGEWYFIACFSVSANGTPIEAEFDLELEAI